MYTVYCVLCKNSPSVTHVMKTRALEVSMHIACLMQLLQQTCNILYLQELSDHVIRCKY